MMNGRAWAAALVPVFASAALAGAGSGIWTVARLSADLSSVADRLDRLETIQRRQAAAITEIESEVDDNGEQIEKQSAAHEIAPGRWHDQRRVLSVMQRRPAPEGEKEPIKRERGPAPDHPGPERVAFYLIERSFRPAG